MRSDSGLVSAASAGDQSALAEIYDRYADRIHDFCHSMLRDRHEAADAMQDTFVLAVSRLDQLRDPKKLRPWLFAIARNEVLRKSRQRQRVVPTEDAGDDIAADDPTPEGAVSSKEAHTIVWEAAAGLSERDQVLLSLNLRQGLEGQELADAIGTTANNAYVLVHRLREQLERSIGALLVARQGRADCDELQELLAKWDGTFTPVWRKRVARHVDDCEVCSEKRRVLTSPLSLLSASALVGAPAELRDSTLAAMANPPRGAIPQGWRGANTRGGFPPPLYPRRRWWLWAGVAALTVLVVGGVAINSIDNETATKPERKIVVTTSSVVTATTTTTTTQVPITTRPRTATVIPEPPDVQGPTLSATMSPNGCSNTFGGNFVLSVQASDPSGLITPLSLAATNSSSAPSSVAPGATATISWAGTNKTITWTVVAQDLLGNQSSISGSFLAQTSPCP